jgi:hypothetical protein
MKSRRTRALSYVGVCVIVGIATAVSAQQPSPPSQEEIERIQQEYQDELRRSTLIGADDDLAIELPNGDLIPVGRGRGCLPPLTRGGLIKVDCTPFDGPAHYFDESTRAMIESCSFWFPDPRRCPPKQWPVAVPGCDAEIPQSITGTWRFYAIPTAGGFSPVDGGWTITLAAESITFDFTGSAQVERSYAVVEQENQRYSLEIRDDRSARTLVDFELAPCGLSIESEGICDAFCENFADEVGVPTDEQIRDIARRIGGGQNDELLERIVATIRESIEQGPQPIFPKRAFFTGEVVQ